MTRGADTFELLDEADGFCANGDPTNWYGGKLELRGDLRAMMRRGFRGDSEGAMPERLMAEIVSWVDGGCGAQIRPTDRGAPITR